MMEKRFSSEMREDGEEEQYCPFRMYGGGRRALHSLDFKIAVITMIEGGSTISEVAKETDLGQGLVSQWWIQRRVLLEESERGLRKTQMASALESDKKYAYLKSEKKKAKQRAMKEKEEQQDQKSQKDQKDANPGDSSSWPSVWDDLGVNVAGTSRSCVSTCTSKHHSHSSSQGGSSSLLDVPHDEVPGDQDDKDVPQSQSPPEADICESSTSRIVSSSSPRKRRDSSTSSTCSNQLNKTQNNKNVEPENNEPSNKRSRQETDVEDELSRGAKKQKTGLDNDDVNDSSNIEEDGPLEEYLNEETGSWTCQVFIEGEADAKTGKKKKKKKRSKRNNLLSSFMSSNDNSSNDSSLPSTPKSDSGKTAEDKPSENDTNNDEVADQRKQDKDKDIGSDSIQTDNSVVASESGTCEEAPEIKKEKSANSSAQKEHDPEEQKMLMNMLEVVDSSQNQTSSQTSISVQENVSTEVPFNVSTSSPVVNENLVLPSYPTNSHLSDQNMQMPNVNVPSVLGTNLNYIGSTPALNVTVTPTEYVSHQNTLGSNSVPDLPSTTNFTISHMISDNAANQFVDSSSMAAAPVAARQQSDDSYEEPVSPPHFSLAPYKLEPDAGGDEAANTGAAARGDEAANIIATATGAAAVRPAVSQEEYDISNSSISAKLRNLPGIKVLRRVEPNNSQIVASCNQSSNNFGNTSTTAVPIEEIVLDEDEEDEVECLDDDDEISMVYNAGSSTAQNLNSYCTTTTTSQDTYAQVAEQSYSSYTQAASTSYTQAASNNVYSVEEAVTLMETSDPQSLLSHYDTGYQAPEGGGVATAIETHVYEPVMAVRSPGNSCSGSRKGDKKKKHVYSWTVGHGGSVETLDNDTSQTLNVDEQFGVASPTFASMSNQESPQSVLVRRAQQQTTLPSSPTQVRDNAQIYQTGHVRGISQLSVRTPPRNISPQVAIQRGGGHSSPLMISQRGHSSPSVSSPRGAGQPRVRTRGQPASVRGGVRPVARGGPPQGARGARGQQVATRVRGGIVRPVPVRAQNLAPRGRIITNARGQRIVTRARQVAVRPGRPLAGPGGPGGGQISSVVRGGQIRGQPSVRRAVRRRGRVGGNVPVFPVLSGQSPGSSQNSFRPNRNAAYNMSPRNPPVRNVPQPAMTQPQQPGAFVNAQGYSPIDQPGYSSEEQLGYSSEEHQGYSSEQHHGYSYPHQFDQSNVQHLGYSPESHVVQQQPHQFEQSNQQQGSVMTDQMEILSNLGII